MTILALLVGIVLGYFARPYVQKLRRPKVEDRNAGLLRYQQMKARRG